MNTLNLGSDEIPEKKKKSNTRNLKIALGLAAVILVPTIGSTLAGSIAINTGANSVEFGQGVAQTAACDPDGIVLTPYASFTNSAGAGSFSLGTIRIGNIHDDCETKTFKIKAYTDDGGAVDLSSNDIVFTYDHTTNNTVCTVTIVNGGTYTPSCAYDAEEADRTSVIIDLAVGINATNISKFTVETSN